MDQNSTEKIIEAIATKMGLTADHFYPILVKQQIVDGVLFIITFLIFLPLSIWFIKFAYKVNKDNWDEIFYVVLGMILFIFFISFLIAGKGLSALINPEYYALKEIMSMVKP